MEMTDRKKQILKIVVEEYVAAAEPVGSKAIAQRMPGKISSATIRNELADLTEMGYLEQPHTSAGRVPSAKGYRLYVNELMEHRALSREEEDSSTPLWRRSWRGRISSWPGQARWCPPLWVIRPIPWRITRQLPPCGGSS